VWLAEVGVFADTTPALPRSVLIDAIDAQWPIARIVTEQKVSAVTVRVELHRHGLFVAHRQRHRSDPTTTAARPPCATTGEVVRSDGLTASS
jgi:hypothetical protein